MLLSNLRNILVVRGPIKVMYNISLLRKQFYKPIKRKLSELVKMLKVPSSYHGCNTDYVDRVLDSFSRHLQATVVIAFRNIKFASSPIPCGSSNTTILSCSSTSNNILYWYFVIK
jgi:hypothetical protein